MTALQSVGDRRCRSRLRVNRAGMHDQTVRFQKFCAFFRQPEQPDVFAESGEIFSPLTFVLKSAKGLRRRPLAALHRSCTKPRPRVFELTWHQRARADQCHMSAELEQAEDV